MDNYTHTSANTYIYDFNDEQQVDVLVGNENVKAVMIYWL